MRPTLSCLAIALAVLAGAGRIAHADGIPLTLAECLRRAMDSSLEIREGEFGPPIAETFISEAMSEFEHLLSFRTAGGKSRLPSGNFLAGGEDKIEEQNFAAGAAIGQKVRTGGTWELGYQTEDLLTDSRYYTVRPAWANSFSFKVNQPLLRYGWREYNEANIRIAEAGTRAARAEFRGVLNQTLAGVERAYWQLCFANANLEVKRQSLRVSEELLRVGRRRLEAGAGTRIEVVQAEAGVADREKELILAEHRAARAADVLRSFVFPFASEPEKELRIVPSDPVLPLPSPPPDTLEDRLRLAFDERPDVEAAKEALEVAGIRVTQRENELLPRLDAFGRTGLAGLDDSWSESVRDSMSRRFPAWEIGIALEIPLGNEAARSRYRRDLLQRGRAAASFESLKNRVVLDVRDAWRQIETASREVEAARRAVAAATAQFDAEKDRVAADKSTNYQLLQTEEDLSAAKSQELLALVGYRAALVNLDEATGTYLEARGLAFAEGESFREEDLKGAR